MLNYQRVDLMSQDVGSLHPQVLTRFLSTSMLNGRVTCFFLNDFLRNQIGSRPSIGPLFFWLTFLVFLHWLKGLCGSDPMCVVWKQKLPPNPSNSSLLPVIFCHNWWYLPIVSYFQTHLDPKMGDSTSAKKNGQQWWENQFFSQPNPIKSVPVV